MVGPALGWRRAAPEGDGMSIREIRLLPSFAIARVGSATVPLDNYTLVEDPEHPLDYRRIKGAPTLIVDDATGKITETKIPETVQFKSEARVRPVAPFFEAFALTEDGRLEQLTLSMLQQHGLGAKDVRWRVKVQNRKVYRRTREPGDIVRADTDWFDGHAQQPLAGHCENFVDSKTIPLGQVRYICPNEKFSEIRLRFTPAPGLIYGPSVHEHDDAVIPDARAVYDSGKGKWRGWDIDTAMSADEKAMRETAPPSLFAITPHQAPPWLHGDKAVSRGYLDDTCDGFVHVKLTISGQELTASARISSGPPDYAPDSIIVRTLADDLEQIVHGPEVGDDDPTVQARAEDIIRRAYETVRLMNVAVMNGNTVKGRPPLSLDTMPAEEAFGTQRMLRPVMAPQNVDTLAVLALHQQAFAALRGGAAPWFLSLLRRPEEAGDLTDRGRRKMPALMCGADGYYLTLTWRQIDTVRKAAAALHFQEERNAPAAASDKPSARRIEPRNLTAQLFYEAVGNPINSRPTMAIGNPTPGLELDFRAVWRRLFEGIELSEHDNYVIDAVGCYAKLKGCRLLCADGRPLVAELRGPSPASDDEDVLVTSEKNPNGVFCVEWSNNLTHVLRKQGEAVECYFTAGPSVEPQPWDDENRDLYHKETLRVRKFFELETAVISRNLAKPGELTQGLCSPWQNDFRECSCYYWSASRPDYVNIEPTLAGTSRGDNWFQKDRTGDYVPDDYVDSRLIGYDDLFLEWEGALKFQIGGRDEPD
jgi:hypothetical protein